MVIIEASKDLFKGLVMSSKFVGTAMFGTAGYIIYNDNARYHKVADYFAKGNLFGPHSDYETCYFPRPTLENTLCKILKPEFTHNYYIINGEVGSGKTRTLVEVTKRQIQQHGSKKKGAPVYVLVSQGSTFAETLANSIGFNFDEHISFKFLISCVLQINSLPKSDEQQKVERVLQAVENAGFYYKAKYGKPAVLVIDGLEMLLQRGELGKEAVQKLQRKAKLWADTSVCKVVFVVNTKSCLDLLQEDKSCWARAAEPVTVGDLSKEDSIKYLTNPKLFVTDNKDNMDSRPILDKENANQVYDLVGGRLQHLKTFKHLYMNSGHFSEVSRILLAKEREKFSMLSRDSEMWSGINFMLKAPYMTVPVTELVRKTSFEALDTLDEYDITRLQHSRMGTLVKFHSPLTVHVARDIDKNYQTVTSFYSTTFVTKFKNLAKKLLSLISGKKNLTEEVQVMEILEGE